MTANNAEWPDWRTVGVIQELHYYDAVRAVVTKTKRGWLVVFPDNVTTVRKTEKEAKDCAENNVICDAELPCPVPSHGDCRMVADGLWEFYCQICKKWIQSSKPDSDKCLYCLTPWPPEISMIG